MNREIFEIIVTILFVACITFIPVLYIIIIGIKSIRQSKYYNKVFNDISIGDEYDWIIYDIDNPFDSPLVCHYKVTNKKSTVDGLFVQLESKSSKERKSVHIDYLIKNYKKV